MIWDCFFFKGPSEFKINNGGLTGHIYWEILKKKTFISADLLGCGCVSVYEDDSDPKHTAKLTIKLFQDCEIKALSFA